MIHVISKEGGTDLTLAALADCCRYLAAHRSCVGENEKSILRWLAQKVRQARASE